MGESSNDIGRNGVGMKPRSSEKCPRASATYRWRSNLEIFKKKKKTVQRVRKVLFFLGGVLIFL